MFLKENLDKEENFSTWIYPKNKLYNISDSSSRDIVNFDFLKKGSRTSLHITFCLWFFKKNIFLVIFYKLTELHCLFVIASWDICQYVQCNCLSQVCDVINFGITYLSFPFYMTKRPEQKCTYLKNKNSFFIIFKRVSGVSDLRVCL